MTLSAHYQLVEFMKDQGLTATAVARTLGVNIPCVSRWCHGHQVPNERNRVMIWALSGIKPGRWDVGEKKDWSEDLEELKPLLEDLLPTAQRHANERIKELSEGVS